MLRKTAIIVYVKYPVPGKVKTRLAKEIGPERAARVYAAMVERVTERTLGALPMERFAPFLYCDPIRPIEDYQTYFRNLGVRIEMQGGESLGARLAQTFSELTSLYPSVITIGSDCLEITPALIEETTEKLNAGADLVLGPATDGGYYLIALKRSIPELFAGVEWSTSTVLATTLTTAKRLGLKTVLLPELSDIDTPDDLKKYPELTIPDRSAHTA